MIGNGDSPQQSLIAVAAGKCFKHMWFVMIVLELLAFSLSYVSQYCVLYTRMCTVSVIISASCTIVLLLINIQNKRSEINITSPGLHIIIITRVPK